MTRDEVELLVRRAGLTLNPGQKADLALSFQHLVTLAAKLPRSRKLADEPAFVFHPPLPASQLQAAPPPAAKATRGATTPKAPATKPATSRAAKAAAKPGGKPAPKPKAKKQATAKGRPASSAARSARRR